MKWSGEGNYFFTASLVARFSDSEGSVGSVGVAKIAIGELNENQ